MEIFKSIFGVNGMCSLIQWVFLIAVFLFHQDLGTLVCWVLWKALRWIEALFLSASSTGFCHEGRISVKQTSETRRPVGRFDDYSDDDEDNDGPSPPLTAWTRKESTSTRVMVDEAEFAERHPYLNLRRMPSSLVDGVSEDKELILSDLIHNEIDGTKQELSGSKTIDSITTLRKQQSHDTVGLSTDGDEDDGETSMKLVDWNNSFHSSSSSSGSSVEVTFVNDFAVAACAANVSRNLRKKVLKLKGSGKDPLSLNASSIQWAVRSVSTGSISFQKQKTRSRSMGGSKLISSAPPAPPIPKGQQFRLSSMGGVNLVSMQRSSSIGGSNLVSSSSSGTTAVQSSCCQNGWETKEQLHNSMGDGICEADQQILERLGQSAVRLNYSK